MECGSLAVLASAESVGWYQQLTVSLSFAVLSLLPGVLLHLSLGTRRLLLRTGGYVLSAAAMATHLSEVFDFDVTLHRFGVLRITFGFGLLAIVAAAALARDRDRRQGASMRVLGAMALFLFAASFFHFGDMHGPSAWTHELFVHHAGIPLALFVLLQDYRFLLLDVFVRFLGSALLAAATAAILIITGNLLGLLDLTRVGGFSQAWLIVALSLTLLGFPALRFRVGKWVERLVFRRGQIGTAVAAIRQGAEEGENEEAFLQRAGREMAGFVKAAEWRVLDAQDYPRGFDSGSLWPQILGDRGLGTGVAFWPEVAVPLRLSSGEVRVLLLGGREAGRRYLGDDLEDLSRLTTEVTDQVDRLRRIGVQRLVSEAELQALRAQINPHFLFNSLNALYGIIPRAATEARRTLMSLAEIFRCSLQGRRQFAPLEEEMRVIEAYLQIERLRLGPRLTTKIAVRDDALLASVPVLSIQPLVENAVKHGVGRRAGSGKVRLEISVTEGVLDVAVSDDGLGFAPSNRRPSGHGLDNVRRRLRLCYGDGTDLQVHSSELGTKVGFSVPTRPVQTARDPMATVG